MSTALVTPMPGARLAQWRAAEADSATPLPEPVDGDGHDAVELWVDDVAVGGAVLTRAGAEAAVRRLQTTLEPDDRAGWSALIAALEGYAGSRGAAVLTTAVAPQLARVFTAAGFRATLTTVSKRYEPDGELELQEDRRVSVRVMDAGERSRFAAEALPLLRSGMERAGLTGSDEALGELPARIARLAEDPPPPDELLLVALLDGVPVGRLWATLTTAADGSLGFEGHSIDLFPAYRGRRLTPSFLGAVRRHLDALEVDSVRGRLYAHAAGARRMVVAEGAGIEEVHLRKELC